MGKADEIAEAIKATIIRLWPKYKYDFVIGTKVKTGPYWLDVLDNYPESFDKPKGKSQISSYYSKDRLQIIEMLNNDPDIIAFLASHSSSSLPNNAQDALPLQEPAKAKNMPIQDSKQKALQPSQPLLSVSVADIAKMVDEAVAKRLSEQPIQKHYDETDLVPEPVVIKGKGKGRQLNRHAWKKSISIDKILWSHFEKEAKERRIPVSRLMDSILWVRYGRPKTTVDE
jgi:hypothetical protein